MHHIHIHAPPMTCVRIHAPHTHTCTTYTYMHYQIPPENKICLVDLTSVLYERPNQNERFLLNNMFFSAFQWNALISTEKCSTFQWNVQCISLKCTNSVKCTVLFTEMCKLSEMRSAFHWNAQTQWNVLCFSLKCANSVKCTVLFTEMRCAFHWNAQTPWKAQHISLKSTAHFSNISWAFGFPPTIGLSYKRPNIGPLVLGSFGMPWNLADFMVESGRFHGHEIWQISWNLADFMPSEPNEPRTYKYTAYLACNVYLYWISWKIHCIFSM